MSNATIYTPEQAFQLAEQHPEEKYIVSGILEAADPGRLTVVGQMFSAEGEALKEIFHLYFHWYNLVHELSHIVTAANGIPNNNSLVAVETMVNRIAAAFWRKYGRQDSYSRLSAAVERALSGMPSPVPQGMDLKTFYADYRNMEDPDMTLYAYFQFSLVQNALRETAGLKEVLESYGLHTKPFDEESIQKPESSMSPQETVMFASDIFCRMGLGVPRVTVFLCSDPVIQCAL